MSRKKKIILFAAVIFAALWLVITRPATLESMLGEYETDWVVVYPDRAGSFGMAGYEFDTSTEEYAALMQLFEGRKYHRTPILPIFVALNGASSSVRFSGVNPETGERGVLSIDIDEHGHMRLNGTMCRMGHLFSGEGKRFYRELIAYCMEYFPYVMHNNGVDPIWLIPEAKGWKPHPLTN